MSAASGTNSNSNSAINNSTTTFEQRTAIQSLKKSPDPIHYNPNYAYRNQPYRLLHHQNGRIGTFHVRLVEAMDLKRSHWSVLGMGVVKHLGLSKAHGEVSSFASVRLGFAHKNDAVIYNDFHRHDTNDTYYNNNVDNCKYNVAATAFTDATSPPSNMNNHYRTTNKEQHILYPNNNKTYQSTTIPFNSNPKWPYPQTSTNKSSFEIPLNKGASPVDGMDILLSIQMKEEKSTVDSFVPIGKGGSDGDGLLGVGEINVTRLVLRDLNINHSCNSTGNNEVVDVYDEWITLSNPFHQQNDTDNQQKHNNNNQDAYYGKVRLLISYEPNGHTPQKNDIIAFESFARQPYTSLKSPSIVPTLHPLRVKDVRGEYILASFDAVLINNSSSSPSSSYKNDGDYCNENNSNNNNYYNNEHRHSSNKTTKPKQGTIRIHRNAIFVIERTNLIDTAVNISLKPTDILLSTQMGQTVTDAAQPYVEAVGDLLAPILLSSKLLLEAGKLGGGAVAIGLKSAVVSVMENSDPEKRRKAQRNSSFD